MSIRSEKRKKVFELYRQGVNRKDIAAQFGIGTGRVSQIIQWEKYRLDNPRWDDGLSGRACNVLWNCDIRSKEQALSEFLAGRFLQGSKPKYRNMGWKSYCELAKWLGQPEPQKLVRKKPPQPRCPHCRKSLVDYLRRRIVKRAKVNQVYKKSETKNEVVEVWIDPAGNPMPLISTELGLKNYVL